MKNKDEQNNNIIYYIVGKNIKKYRKLKGLTQEQFANKCNLSTGFISDLESDTFRTISLNTLYLIAQKLDIHIRQLFDDVEK